MEGFTFQHGGATWRGTNEGAARRPPPPRLHSENRSEVDAGIAPHFKRRVEAFKQKVMTPV